MAGTVYLRTNHFEVKLEGITFKTKDFESLCKMDFLFPDGKEWDRKPIVGIDVMRHPRDPSILLLLLCFGVGCVILRFSAGETLPAPIHKFLADRRIQFVGFAIPEKKDLFPFEELGLSKNEVDVGYLAARILKDPKYKRCELAELARKVLGIKRMIGLTEASSLERHEQVKCAICQLFITIVIAMGLLGANDKKKFDYCSKKSSFLKNLNSLHLLVEGWFKLPKSKKIKQEALVRVSKVEEDVLGHHVHANKEGPFVNCFFNPEIPQADSGDYQSLSKIKEDVDVINLGDCAAAAKVKDKEHGKDRKDDPVDDGSGKEQSCTARKPLKGILKCPSTTLQRSNSPATPPSPDQAATGRALRSANSKGCNVSFNFR